MYSKSFTKESPTKTPIMPQQISKSCPITNSGWSSTTTINDRTLSKNSKETLLSELSKQDSDSPMSSSRESRRKLPRKNSQASYSLRIPVSNVQSENPTILESGSSGATEMKNSTMQCLKLLPKLDTQCLNLNGSTSITSASEFKSTVHYSSATSASNLVTPRTNVSQHVLPAHTVHRRNTNAPSALTNETTPNSGVLTVQKRTPNSNGILQSTTHLPPSKTVQDSSVCDSYSKSEQTTGSRVLRVVQCNLAKSFNSQKEFLEFFHINKYDIALISEPYCGNTDVAQCVTGVDLYQYSSNSRVKTCIWIKKNSFVTLGLSEYSNSNLTAVSIKIHQRRLILASLYIEPDQDPNNTLNAVDLLLKKNENTHVIIGGDANGKHPEWGCEDSDDRGDSIASIFASNNMYSCSTGSTPTFQATRGDRVLTSIIDITYASESIVSRVKEWKVNVAACISSDHHAIEFAIEISGVVKKCTRESTYIFNNKTANWSKFHETLARSMQESWILDSTPSTPEDIDHHIHEMNRVITESCFKSMKIRGTFKPYNPFWTPELEEKKQECLRSHHRLQKLKRKGLISQEVVSEYSELKAKYSKAISKASIKNFREFCNKQGPEDVWSLTNRLIKDSPTNQPPSTLKVAESYTRTSEETGVTLLNHFYPDDSIDTLPRHEELRKYNTLLSDGTDEPPFTPDEIQEALYSMNPNRAPGHDHLTSDICSEFFTAFPGYLCNLLNSCLELGYFPKSWKDARVKILQKPGKDDYSDLSSFRPIGLLPVLGKLLEKLMIKRLTYSAQTANAWSLKQFGFREQTSTIEALHTLLTKIKDSKASKKQVLGVSLDIKAAFDNAWWPALMSRLRITKCPLNIHKLIQSYLQDRNVTLEYADSKCSKTMTKGCIQGSVCGPTFWNLILDELLELELPSGCYIQAYADDVMLVVTGNSATLVEQSTIEALSVIKNWGDGVKLRFSPAKTQAIAFTPALKNVKLTMDSQSVQMNNHIKLLGIIIDSNLNFIQHARYVIKKVTKTFKKLCKFVRPTWGVHPENVETIYRRVIEPTITYAAGVWGSAVLRESVKRILRTFQRSYAIRAIRAFHTVSAVSANALSQFMPLHLKVLEVHKIEQVKLTGVFPELPEDRTLESRVLPSSKLHPSKRIKISYSVAGSVDQVNEHASETNIYTDGSKLDSCETGAAFIILHPTGRQESRKFKLDQTCTVFQAELLALQKALDWVEKNSKTGVTIYSDSMSSLQAIQQRSNSHPLVNSIHHTLHRITQRAKIKFVWVKAHIGIPGNEAADSAAKEAAAQRRSKVYSDFPLSYAKHHIRQQMRDSWSQEYLQSVQGSATRMYFPTLESIKKFKEFHDLTFELTQVFTGHNFTNQYLHRFHIKESSTCPCDSHSEQNMQHLITQCPRYENFRYSYLGSCKELRVRPTNIVQLLSYPGLLDKFVTFVTHIVSTLKSFNA